MQHSDEATCTLTMLGTQLVLDASEIARLVTVLALEDLKLLNHQTGRHLRPMRTRA
jgi:hypothetical protein